MRRVYICHPYRNDPVGNLEKVKKIVLDISKSSVSGMKTRDKTRGMPSNDYEDIECPVSPMLAFPFEMTEYSGNNISEKHGMAFCLALLDSCDELWVYSNTISKGMKLEIEHASKKGIEIVWKV